MLLTGFDAKRLKKLYVGRVIRKYNLLQALTRVNRPYRDFRYGYVVDFADIRKEFDATNKAYFEELQADKLKNTLRQTREALVDNFDQQDPRFISLKEELERLFKKKKLNEVTQEEMNANIGALNQIYVQVKELNRQNNQLRAKYHGDPKYTRIHKRLLERGLLFETERRIFEALTGVKQQADEQVLQNTQLLANESYFERMMMPMVIGEFQTRRNIKLNPDASRMINRLVVTEYMNEFISGNRKGACAW